MDNFPGGKNRKKKVLHKALFKETKKIVNREVRKLPRSVPHWSFYQWDTEILGFLHLRRY